MARGGVNKELAATVLIEAIYLGDEKACARYGVAAKSLYNYRKLLASGDPQLAEFYRRKKAAFDAQWAEKLPLALDQSVQFLAAAAAAGIEDNMIKRNPMMISAVAGAMKLLADVLYTGKVIDARLAQTNRETAGLPGQVPAEDDADSDSALVH
jgi:hypothetical protein